MRRFSTARALVLAGTIAVAGGGYVAYERLTPHTVEAAVVTSDVQVGNVSSAVSATGNVAATTQADLGFDSGGKLTGLLVSVGDQVAAGQALATINPAGLQAAVDQAQAAYDSAVAQLETARAGTRPEEIAAAQAQVTTA